MALIFSSASIEMVETLILLERTWIISVRGKEVRKNAVRKRWERRGRGREREGEGEGGMGR